jgi:predicted dehydrogenase
MAVYDDLADQEQLRIYDKGIVPSGGDNVRSLPMSYRYGGTSSPHIQVHEPLKVQDEHFVECVLAGRRPWSDGESGLAVVQVLEAAERSLRRGTAILLSSHEAHTGKKGLVSAAHFAREGA